MIPILIKEKGILNVGGKKRDIYDFAKKYDTSVKPINLKKIKNFPSDSSMNIQKLKKILKKNNFKINGNNYNSCL